MILMIKIRISNNSIQRLNHQLEVLIYSLKCTMVKETGYFGKHDQSLKKGKRFKNCLAFSKWSNTRQLLQYYIKGNILIGGKFLIKISNYKPKLKEQLQYRYSKGIQPMKYEYQLFNMAFTIRSKYFYQKKRSTK